MKKLFVALVILTSACFVAQPEDEVRADLPIPKEFRPLNSQPGRCAWCTLETLGLYHGYEVMKDLQKRNARAGRAEWYHEQLKKHKVKYDLAQYHGTPKMHRWVIDKYTIDTWDTSWIEWACNKGYGCAVVYYWDATRSETHMVVMTEFDKESKKIKVIDSNNKKKETETRNLAWFLYWWEGTVLIIYPREGVKNEEKTARVLFEHLGS